MPADKLTLQAPAEDVPALTSSDLSEISACAERIRAREKAVREGATAYLHNGRDLSAMKARLGHGAFIPWCEREFKDSLGWSVRTIERMMLAADGIGDKIDSVSNLKVPKTAIYAITAPSTPAKIRQDFLDRIGAGDASATTAALAEIKSAKDDAIKEDRRARQTPEAGAKAERREQASRKRQEAELAKRDAEDADRKAALSEAVALITDLMRDDVDRIATLFERAGFGVTELSRMLRERMTAAQSVEIEADGARHNSPQTTCCDDDGPIPDQPAMPRRGAGSADRYAAFHRNTGCR